MQELEQLRETRLVRSRAYVAGEWVEADGGAARPGLDPATGAETGSARRMGAAETRRAIEAARAAQPAWRRMLAKERARILRRWSDLMLEHRAELALLMTAEQGKPLAESQAEIDYAASF